MLWIRIRIRKDPKLIAGSRYGCVTQSYGSGSVTISLLILIKNSVENGIRIRIRKKIRYSSKIF
jgi:hypothetical protein